MLLIFEVPPKDKTATMSSHEEEEQEKSTTRDEEAQQLNEETNEEQQDAEEQMKQQHEEEEDVKRPAKDGREARGMYESHDEEEGVKMKREEDARQQGVDEEQGVSFKRHPDDGVGGEQKQQPQRQGTLLVGVGSPVTGNLSIAVGSPVTVDSPQLTPTPRPEVPRPGTLLIFAGSRVTEDSPTRTPIFPHTAAACDSTGTGTRHGAYEYVPGQERVRRSDVEIRLARHPSSSQSGAEHRSSSGETTSRGASTDPPTCARTSAPDHSGLVQASAVHDDIGDEDDVAEATPVDLENLERQKRERQRSLHLFLLAIGCVTLLAVAIGAVLVTQLPKIAVRDNGTLVITNQTAAPSTSPPTIAPSAAPSMMLLADLDLPNYTLESLQDPFSPQSMAYEWLLDHPNATLFPEWRKQQLFAMATFFYAFDGPHWPELIRKDWMDVTRNECNWYSGKTHYLDVDRVYYLGGSSCNDQDELAYLSLTTLNLTGFQPIIPPEIELLTKLELLQLSGNGLNNCSLNQMLPSQLYQMSSLTSISLSNDHFFGSIPSEIGLMSNHLTKLFVGANPRLSGTVPTELGRLSNLEHLILMNNTQMTGSLPTELGRMTSLTELVVSGRSFSPGPLPSELGLLEQMQSLYILDTLFTGPIPSEMVRLTNMSHFGLYDNNDLTGTIPSSLGLLGSLEVLDLRNCSFTGIIPTELGMITSLTELYLGQNNLSGSVASELGLLEDGLLALHLDSNLLTGMIATELGLLTDLKELHLPYNALTGTIPLEMSTLVAYYNLSSFHVEGNPLLGGVLAHGLCMLQNSSCTYVDALMPWKSNNCSLDFDCSNRLCGCDCECQ